ncbi:very short patch repair endonuclease [Brevundimonas lutea]|uniref:very short patch repair endonuclease n=1 Tax=Brevundimonas lutea TaxID=2293980 RepID=UPI000F02B12F|nr:DNA mismatch endonuclease Vsr [Brevundimonas lutea]
MTDVYGPEKRSAVMRRVRARDTGPELKVRKRLRALGVGYRLGGWGLPGRPDVVMPGRRLAIFVHGCFWHGHDCPRGGREPKTNADYWRAKIARNRQRDRTALDALENSDWRTLVLWECQLKDEAALDRRLAAVVSQAASVSA